MSKSIFTLICITLLAGGPFAPAQEAVFPGADESTPSRSEYFSWINNTNEGSTEAQTRINLEFFQWLNNEYGMKLDIYAFDAGAIDGKRFYGRVDSDRFAKQFPRGFDPVYQQAKAMGTRLGIWGGPDGFGNSPEEEAARIEQMVSLCRDYEFALFKFDAVCGPLRPEKEDAFIRMMTLCRQYSPDLILLNHRLSLERARAHATTFLWEGKETYIDVFSANRVTAPHHRAEALSRGLPPDLKRLTEDHGVCLSSCLDFWEDDLVLQAFNRSLILSPQLYGNPWLLRDDEFPRLARIFNLHRKYRHLLINGMVLPEEKYGPFAVSRGDDKTRLITLRNLTWETKTYEILLNEEIGLSAGPSIHCRRFHPVEKILGDFEFRDTVEVVIAPFRSCLILATSEPCDEPGIGGCEYYVTSNLPDKPVKIQLLGKPGHRYKFSLPWKSGPYSKAILDGQNIDNLLEGEVISFEFPGQKRTEPFHRKLADMKPCDVPDDAEAFYEATVFAADNNALEVRCLERSGKSAIPQVIKAREAFFNQSAFKERGVWDRNLFDNDPTTGFWPSRKYRVDQRVKGGCFRLDLGEVVDADRIVLHVPDDYSLQPLLREEAYYVETSADLKSWRALTYMAGKRMTITPDEPVRYLRFSYYPDRIVEIEGYRGDGKLPREKWRVSNLFAHASRMKPIKAWRASVVLDEWVEGSYLCIALEGVYGVEGAYAALKVGGRHIGCPDRAPSYPSNTWEYVNARTDRNYTYYAPVSKEMIGRPVEVLALAYDEENLDLKPVVWVTAHSVPFASRMLELHR